jgi:hypothetical protein
MNNTCLVNYLEKEWKQYLKTFFFLHKLIAAWNLGSHLFRYHVAPFSIVAYFVICTSNKKNQKKTRRKYIVMSSDTKRTDKIAHYLYWPTFIKILLTNLLYYDYKCICFINLLAGHYRIYGALIQGIMEKSGPLWKKWRQTLTRSLEFCFFQFWLKIVIVFKNRKQGILRKSRWVK